MYKLVYDNDGHQYVIPVDQSEAWYAWCELDQDSEEAWEPPDWATRVEGGLVFDVWRIE